MKYLLSLIIGFISLSLSANEISFNNEKVNYKVMYKWGLVNKQAGTATLTITNKGDNYITKLTARSDPWADKFYTVRDTLNGIIKKAGFLPMFYEKKAHEGGEFKHDIVKYSRSGNKVLGYCTRIKRDEDEAKGTKKEHIISTTGTTVDMLSVYYYMRALNYNSMKKNQVMKLTIFSGKRKELLTIKYHGTENVAYDNKSYNCYHISFTFTSDGGKKTSDDMDAWITTDSKRIPVKLEGVLPVGKVQCFCTGYN